MRVRPQATRSLVSARLVVVACVSFLSACSSGTPARQCVVYTPNSTWQSIGFKAILSEPRRCPYVVRAAGDSAQYAIEVRGPALYGGFGAPFGASGKLKILNALGQPASRENQQFYAQLPFNPDSGFIQ